MKSTAPLIATAAGIVAVIVGVFLFGDRLGLGEKPAEPKAPSSNVTSAEKAETPPASGNVESDDKETSTETAPSEAASEEIVKPGDQTAAQSVADDTAASVAAPEADQTKSATEASGAADQESRTAETVGAKVAEGAEAKPTEQAADDAKGSEAAQPADTSNAQGTVAADAKGDAPSFDIVRVEPDGNTLVAGRATPNWMVELRNGAEVIAKTTADANGEWVIILEKALELGVSDLSLAAMAAEGGEALTSASSVTVARPEDGKGELLVVENIPGQPSKILAKIVDQAEKAAMASEADKPEDAAASNAEPKAPAKQEMAKAQDKAAETQSKPEGGSQTADTDATASANDPADSSADSASVAEKPAVVGRVSIEAVEIEGNTVFVAGAAEPAGSLLRMYVDNKAISDTRSGETGRFLFDGELQLEPGRHALRVDLIDGANGAVINRAEVAFVKKALASEAQTAQVDAKSGQSAEDTQMTKAGDASENSAQMSKSDDQNQMSKQEGASSQTQSEAIKVLGGESNRVIIRRGDNLWEIARRVYGAGIRYSTIYDSNSGQIRDPHWIYPGQVFQLPKGEEGWETNFDAVEHPTADELPAKDEQN